MWTDVPIAGEDADKRDLRHPHDVGASRESGGVSSRPLRRATRFFGSPFLGGFGVAFIRAVAGNVALSPRCHGAATWSPDAAPKICFKTALDGFFCTLPQC
ncbi:MAG TPA: hypothetical protein VMV69_04215 [Pirellulales bacterium]|nr:hypothetical protein [Pirellulales bacterium]